jgi:SAM-dependent methyltransferase
MEGETVYPPIEEAPAFKRLREPGWALLKGSGLEIGALHEPAPLPAACTVEYVDAITRAEAAALFPEVDAALMVEPHHIRDIDREGLTGLGDDHYDFVVLSHVIEHLADPIGALKEVFRLLRPGGHAVIAAPDRHYTFDRQRGNSPFGLLLSLHLREVKKVSDEQYIDFLGGVYPKLLREGGAALDTALASVRARREHAHVWDSTAFREFLDRALSHLAIHAELLYESTGAQNSLEHFSVWRKLDTHP